MARASIVAGIILVGVLAAGGGLVYKLRSGASKHAEGAAYVPMEAVQIVEAREEPWTPTADIVGTVFAKRSVTVRNELAGVVRFVGFDSGDEIKEGQVVLRQDDATEQADLNAAKAAVRIAEANLSQAESEIALAEIEYNRMAGIESKAIAGVELDRARTKLDSAKADRSRWMAEADQATAHVAQVQARLEKLTLKAPFRARAGLRTVHEGQYLKEGTDIVQLQELTDTIFLDFAIPQEYAPRVKVGTTVMADAPLLGDGPVKITVAAIDATVNTDTRNLRIRAVVDNAKGNLVPGMSIQVRVPIDEPKQLVAVPSTAIRRAAFGDSVFVITTDKDKDGHESLVAHQRFVTLGQATGEDVIVAKGLKVGERVAAAGSFKLRDGALVMDKPPEEPEKKQSAEAGKSEETSAAAVK
ncbi:MAG: efflux RND transporter periplasmic adaptor subunit [Phycisphaerales bacterium]|jgi:membrane fusion protein (multidrug efflux system)